jgi:hypothetical protein
MDSVHFWECGNYNPVQGSRVEWNTMGSWRIWNKSFRIFFRWNHMDCIHFWECGVYKCMLGNRYKWLEMGSWRRGINK